MLFPMDDNKFMMNYIHYFIVALILQLQENIWTHCVLVCCRYDGRGHLYDLSQYDADILDKQHEQLSKEEMAIEAACDEERYLELVTDVQEKAMYEGDVFSLLNFRDLLLGVFYQDYVEDM